MLDTVKNIWRRIAGMFGYTTIKNVIGRDVVLSQAMIDAINDWKNMLNGNARLDHRLYQVIED